MTGTRPWLGDATVRRWFSDAAPEQLQKLLRCVDCIADEMANSLRRWAREESPWYAGIDDAVRIAQRMCDGTW